MKLICTEELKKVSNYQEESKPMRIKEMLTGIMMAVMMTLISVNKVEAAAYMLGTKAPKTGDPSQLWLFVGILGGSAVACLIMFILLRRGQKKEQQ